MTGPARRLAGRALACRRLVLALAPVAAWLAIAVAGCGGEPGPALRAGTTRPATFPPPATTRWPVPVATGRTAAFRLPPRGARAAGGAPIGALRCRRDPGRRRFAHLELFAAGRVVPIPPGIGIAPPLARAGAYVRAGRCSYPVRTTEPTGLLSLRAVGSEKTLTLGALFDVWGQPLSRRRMASFRGSARDPVRAYVGGRRRRGDPRAIALTPHAVIVLELGPLVPPHRRYVFPPGE